MPTESIYLPDDARQYVRDIETNRNLDNPSQAVQAIIEDHREAHHE